MGNCPVYFLIVYDNGLAMYKGRNNVEMKGKYYTALSRKDFKKIKQAFDEASLTQYQDHYPAEVTDMPGSRITYNAEGNSKTVSGDGDLPQVVLDLHRLLDDLITQQEWKKIE